MIHLLMLAAALLVATPGAPAAAPSLVHVRVLDAESGDSLPGATVVVDPDARPVGGITDADGRVTVGPVADGPHTVAVSFVGYAEARLALTLPLADTLVVRLAPEAEESEEAVVSATRTTRTIDDTPTRVETIGGEEIEEKVNMDPSGIAMVLNESPGIVVQQTSAVSASASFRIQGLDGRYTQLLRDGFPLYGGLSGGLSLLQIPPLDLARVEVIKGPASTLYGGGAIAGLVNLVSKQPGNAPERLLLVNGTTAGGLDVAGYASARTERLGYTVLASANGQRAFDAEGDAFTNLPATQRLTLSPTLYRYGAGTLTAGLSGTLEAREGGAVAAVRDEAAGYTERNGSGRLTAFAGYSRLMGGDSRLVLRSSGSAFRRSVETPGFRFAGRQMQTYTEASVDLRRGAHEVVAGLDGRTDRFDQSDGEADPLDYAHASTGVFVQDTWDFSTAAALETGLRVEGHTAHGAFVLPRLSLLVRPGGGFTARVGGGLGYKAPTPFLEEAETRAYRGVRPVADATAAERSAGGTVDVNYRGALGPVGLSLNQAVYLTRLSSPLVPFEAGDVLSFRTADGHIQTAGAETTARLSLGEVGLFLGYVYLDARRTERGQTEALPLTARHRTYTVLVWEQEGRGRIGLEAYYTGPQRLTSGERTPGYLLAGLMAERRFGPVRAFVNVENVLDARQSRTAPVVTGSAEAPAFAEIWGPTDGFIANAGLKVEL
ncbi:MAG TPA: TonB-dependent receptor [Rubricoccaceae bacterium]|jgi:iron complex outermembrane receptor protein